MKKIYLLLVVAIIAIGPLSAQLTVPFSDNMESWTSTAPIVPTNWNGSKTSIGVANILQYTASVHGGTYACQLRDSTSTHKRFTTKAFRIEIGKSYQISFWVRGQGEIRTGGYKGTGSSGAAYYTYNAYEIINTTTWEQHTQTITSDTTSDSAQFIISVRNTVGAMGHLQIDDINIDTAGAVPPTTASIYEIQYTIANPAVSPYANQVVTTGGIVSGMHSKGVFIQDAQGPWHGLYIYDSAKIAAAGIVRGDSIMVKGSVTEYNGYTELQSVTEVTKVSSGNTEYPAYIRNSASDVNSEDLEGVLVQLNNAKAGGSRPYGMKMVYTNNDMADSCKIHGLLYPSLALTFGNYYNITGPVFYSFNEYRILPRSISDVEATTSISELNDQDFVIYPNPATTNLTINNIKGIDQLTISNILGETVLTNKVYGNTSVVNIEKLESGIYFVTFMKDNTISGTRKFTKL